VSWAAFHASRQQQSSDDPAITALLPLFAEKAGSPAMVKHGMNIIKTITNYVNPGQIPVIACDCPIFAMCKYIQWYCPSSLGEDKFVVMFGGLHLEKGLWTALGTLLDSSGWTQALSEAEVASAGTAESFIHVSHITRTRHAHQVTAIVLSKLQQDAYEQWRGEMQGQESFEDWKINMVDKYPTFQYWNLVLTTEIHILILVRAQREKNLALYIECLETLMFLFFALDHFNYSRWISVHLRDMKSLPATIKTDFEKHWVVTKSNHRFSALPLDQIHEQENAKVKDKGGIIGLTENASALDRLMICGPDQARLLGEFESQYMKAEDPEVNYKHHEEGMSSQKSFMQQVKSLTAVINKFGNPFMDDCPELVVFHSRDCAPESTIDTVKSIEKLGTEQYRTFKKEVLEDRSKSIHEPLKKNKLHLFRTPKPKTLSKDKKLVAVQSDANLFGRLYMANQMRNGDPDVFFSHENQSYPPSLSEFGNLRKGTKSDLIKCLDIPTENETQEGSHFDSAIFDGAVIVHLLSVSAVTNFEDYADKVFLGFLRRELVDVSRVDVVWDRYLPRSIKEATREKRGRGCRLKVNSQTRVPSKSKWNDFLRDPLNKSELFDFLSKCVGNCDWPQDKEIYITSGSSVLHRGSGESMSECSQEEADTRIMVHIKHALEAGSRRVKVRTVDTDILVILIGQFHHLLHSFPGLDLWVEFGISTYFISINSICEKLGEHKARCLPMFHAFSGSDTTSSFFRKGKKSVWEAWKSYPAASEAFLYIAENPFKEVNVVSPHFKKLERLTVILYDRTSNLLNVNEARRELFCKKQKSLDSIPPTQVIKLLIKCFCGVFNHHKDIYVQTTCD
jgi:hypothetical protein